MYSMSASARYDVLGLGCTAVDDLLYVAAYPPPDTKVQIRRRERQCGGLTATALVAAARLGACCAFAGVLGDDPESSFVIDTFRQAGVSVEHLVHRPEARPIRSTIIVDEAKQTRTILYDLTGSAGADPQLPAEEVIRSTRVLYVDHYGIEGMTRAAQIARSAAIPIVADFERSEWPGFGELLGMVDHLIVNRDFATRLTSQAEPAAALLRLWSGVREVVIVTCGEAGCWYLDKREPGVPRHQPAFAIEAVDTTGCGDVFHGAYAAALARGLPPIERIRFAAAAAAIKATRPGAQGGIPTLGEVESLLSSPY
jgi:sulfofructose kinase